MAGAVAVSSVNTYERIYHVRVLTCGTTGTNLGNITIANTLATMTVGYIVVGEGASHIPIFTVPRLHRATILRFSYGEVAQKSTQVAMWVRPFGGAWYMSRLKVIRNQTSSSTYVIPHVYEAKTDIEIRAIASGGGGSVQASFCGYYRK